MDRSVLADYVERIFSYALKKTFSEDEAEELAQEILLAAITKLDTLRSEESFEPWLWGVARNTAKSFRRHMGRQRAMYVYDAPAELVCQPHFLEDDSQLYADLRRRIAMLSKIYRDIIILYYYDGLSVKQISQRLDIPEGTVTWRLSEARKKLKKECVEMNETALRPVKMRIDIYGEGDYNCETKPFPDVYISDALSQNILYYCYEKAQGIEELAKLCGVPAYYIEDRIENLVDRCAVIQPSKGKYQTDFIIWTDKYGKYDEENAEAALSPVMDKLVAALEELYQAADEIDFYRAEKSGEELKYLYGAMAFELMSKMYNFIEYPEIEPNYDGNRFRYIANMETGKYHRMGVGVQYSANNDGNYSHTVYWMDGFAGRNMMYDNYVNVCADILTKGHTEDEMSAAKVIKDGYIIRRENGELFVTVPAFDKEQKARFDRIADRILSPLMPEYAECVRKYISGYKKLFPKHLENDAQRMCCTSFRGFYDCIMRYSRRKGILRSPESIVCDVLVQWR